MPYLEGLDAALAGDEPDDNPYEPGTKPYDLWELGFEDAPVWND